MSGTGNSVVSVLATGDQRIDGILYDRAWSDAVVTYSMPTSASTYGPGYGANENLGLRMCSDAMSDALRFYLDTQFKNSANNGFAVEGFTNIRLKLTSAADANIRLAQTTRDPFDYKTAWGYYPSTEETGGDVWMHTEVYDYTNPQPGGYSNVTLIHEIGHTLGLEHGHQTTKFGRLPLLYDSMEYTVMTYRSHVGADAGKYSNEPWGYPQSYMMLDIAALQHIYGANYTTNNDDTVYAWSPKNGTTMVNGEAALTPGSNRIFTTIWDGGGNDTYDLQAYKADLSLDLAPGAASSFGKMQIARLAPGVFAEGNIYNALLHKEDIRSLIENAIAGSGNDKVSGNEGNNRLEGRDGDDELTGFDGNDQLLGQRGMDVLWGRMGADTLRGALGDDRLVGGRGEDRLFGGADHDRLHGGHGRDRLEGGDGNDVITGGKGQDTLIGNAGRDVFKFNDIAHSSKYERADNILDFVPDMDLIDLSRLSKTDFLFCGAGAFLVTGPSVIQRHAEGETRLYVDVDSDGESDMRIDLAGLLMLDSDDFIL